MTYVNQTRNDGEPTDEALITFVQQFTQSHNKKPVVTLEKLTELVGLHHSMDSEDAVQMSEDRIKERLGAIIEEQHRLIVEKIDIDGTTVYAGSEFGWDLYQLGLIGHRHEFNPENFETHEAGWFYDTHGTRENRSLPDYPDELKDALRGKCEHEPDSPLWWATPTYLTETEDSTE